MSDSQNRKVKTLNVAIDPVHDEYLRRKAKDAERSVSWIVRQLVQREMIEEATRAAMREQAMVTA